jgi:Na+/H+ antiporter NhaC
MSGMQAFISSVPMNLYAILTLYMIVWLSIRKNSDYGPMATAQKRTEETGIAENAAAAGHDEIEQLSVSSSGKVTDLILPVVLLVFFSVIAMLWYGGYWDGGISLFEAFGETAAGAALALGGFLALIAAFLLFVPRKLVGFKDFFAATGQGIKSMTPAIIILTLAWTISGICRELLNTGSYVASIVETSSMPVILIPAIMFIVAAILSFATGTSWGTFGILIPITISICDIVAPELNIVSLSAVLAGSVLGDHCSPISDTTILSSTGARCNHIDHVATQLPYALTVAAVCFIGYIIAGFTSKLGLGGSTLITLPVSIILLTAALLVLPKVWKTS